MPKMKTAYLRVTYEVKVKYTKKSDLRSIRAEFRRWPSLCATTSGDARGEQLASSIRVTQLNPGSQ